MISPGTTETLKVFQLTESSSSGKGKSIYRTQERPYKYVFELQNQQPPSLSPSSSSLYAILQEVRKEKNTAKWKDYVFPSGIG